MLSQSENASSGSAPVSSRPCPSLPTLAKESWELLRAKDSRITQSTFSSDSNGLNNIYNIREQLVPDVQYPREREWRGIVVAGSLSRENGHDVVTQNFFSVMNTIADVPFST